MSDPSAVLPRYENVICAKVLRLDRLPKPRSTRLRRKAPYGGGKAGTAGTAAVGGEQRANVGGTSSWRAEEAHRRPSQVCVFVCVRVCLGLRLRVLCDGECLVFCVCLRRERPIAAVCLRVCVLCDWGVVYFV